MLVKERKDLIVLRCEKLLLNRVRGVLLPRVLN
jgi:hypothetical protein